MRRRSGRPTSSTSRPLSATSCWDRERPLWFCESTRKADSAAERGGLCAVGINGVNGWMHTCPITKDKVPLPELKHIPVNDRDVVIALDNDIETNMSVTKAALGLARILAARGAKVRFLYLPNDGTKTGLDDYLFGHTVEDLMLLLRPEPPVVQTGFRKQPGAGAVQGADRSDCADLPARSAHGVPQMAR